MARIIPAGEDLTGDVQDVMRSEGEVIEVVLADGFTTQVVSVAEAEEMKAQGLLLTPATDGKALTEEDVYGADIQD